MSLSAPDTSSLDAPIETNRRQDPAAIGRFGVVAPLGEGSSSSVWEVIDPARPGRRLALKVLRPGPRLDEDHVRELAIGASLRHPALVPTLEAGTLESSPLGDGAPYLLTELCPGAPLGSTGPVPADDLTRIAAQLFGALDAIHGAGYRHGDLKPANLLVEPTAEGPIARVLDFGLARRLDERPERSRAGGTPRYLAPEVLRGFSPGASADLYALGICLLESLRGPITTPIAEHLFRTRQGLVFREVSETEWPAPFHRLLVRLLDPDPEARLASGADGLALLRAEDALAPTAGSVAREPGFECARTFGRDNELAAIEHALARQARSRSHATTWWILGDRGAGKSRVLHEARLAAARLGLPTREHAFELARSMDSSDDSTPGLDSWSFSRRAEDRLADRLLAIAAERPALLVFDDLDRRTPAELSSFRLFLERLRDRASAPAISATVLVALRPEALHPSFRAWWSGDREQAWTRVLQLEPLGVDAMRAILDGALPPRREESELDSLVLDAARGSPGRLRAILRSLHREGRLVLEEGAWRFDRQTARGVPALAGEAEEFRRAWATLERRDRAVIAIHAVWIGSGSAPDVASIANALGLTTHAVAESHARLALTFGSAREELVAGDLRPDRVTRLRTARAIGPRGRRRARRQIARSTAPPLERLAQRARIGKARASEVLRVELSSPEDGLRLLSFCALRGSFDRETRAECATRIAERLAQEDQETGAAAIWLRFALEHVESPRLRRRIDLLRAENALFRGHVEEAESLFARLAGSGGSAKRRATDDGMDARRLWGHGQSALMRGDLELARACAESARKRHPEHLRLLDLRAHVLAREGRSVEAASLFEEGIRRARERGHERAAAALGTNLGRLLQETGETHRAIELHVESAQSFERHGLRAQAARAWGNAYTAQRRNGEHILAQRSADRSVDLFRAVGDELGQALAEANRGILAREIGLLGTAWRRFETMERLLRGAGENRPAFANHPVLLASRALLANELGDPREEILRVAEGEALVDTKPRVERLLLELRRLQAGRPVARDQLFRHLRKRRWIAGDAPVLYELAGLESAHLDPSADRELPSLRALAREELDRLALTSPLAACLAEARRRVSDPDSEESSTPDDRDAALLDRVDAHRLRGPLFDLALTLARTWSSDALRARARARLRRLADECLFDLPTALRDALSSQKRFQEVLAVSREGEPEPTLATQGARDALRQLFHLNRQILEETDPARLLARIVDAALELTRARRGFLAVKDRGLPSFVAARSDGADLPDPDSLVSHTLVERTLADGVARISTDARQDLALESIASVEELGLRSILCAPLVDGEGRPLGVLYLDNSFQEGVFSAADLELVESFCSQASIVWWASKRRQEVESLVEELRLANLRLEGELTATRRDQRRQSRDLEGRLEGMIGSSARMRQVFQWIEAVAPTEIPVLITGESGTGKELVARALHQLSDRRAGPFVAENCGAVPDTLLESTLFGHVKGAFTGADRDRRGLFELADGGTLLLDEIGELPVELQTRLLRVLQEGEVRPVGAQMTRKVDVRIIAATHRNVRDAIEHGSFRQDLYYRLQGAEIAVPALRERRADIPLLVEHFLRQHLASGVEKELAPETLERLTRHDWPGNVRELENEVRRLALLAPGPRVGPESLSIAVRDGRGTGQEASSSGAGVRPLRAVEEDAILLAMEHHGGHRSQVAEALGISRSTLYLKLKEIGYVGS